VDRARDIVDSTINARTNDQSLETQMTKQIMQIDVLSEWVSDDQVAEYLSEHLVTVTIEVHWQHHKPGHYTGVQGWELISWNILEIALDDVELTDQDIVPSDFPMAEVRAAIEDAEQVRKYIADQPPEDA
jgi:hypothetical protein